MRFIRRCLIAASYILVFLGSAQAQSVTIGSNAVWSGGNDSANGNLLSAQIAKLIQDRNRPEPVVLRHRRERKSDPWDLRRQRPQGRSRRAQSLDRQLYPDERLEYGPGGHACDIGCRQLLARLSAEQQCSWVPKNEQDRQL